MPSCLHVFRYTSLLGALLLLAAWAPALRAQEEIPRAADVRDSVRATERRIHDQERQLETLRQEIRDLRRRDQQLKKEEVGTLDQLKILDKEVALTTDLLRELEAKQERLQGQLEGIRAEHARAEEILVDRKSRLAPWKEHTP